MRFYSTFGVKLPTVSSVAKSSYSPLVFFPIVYRTLILSKFRNAMLLCFQCVSHSSFLLVYDIQTTGVGYKKLNKVVGIQIQCPSTDRQRKETLMNRLEFFCFQQSIYQKTNPYLLEQLD